MSEILSPPALVQLAQRHGAEYELAQMVAAAALVESGGNPRAVGDNGASHGLWQLHERGLGAGMTVAERQDPDTAARAILPHFQRHYADGKAAGHVDEDLAAYTILYTERPFGFPNLWSPAALKYRARWREVTAMTAPREPPMEYASETSPERQVQSWTCSVRTSTWMLRSLGYNVTAAELQASMQAASVVDADVGLRDGSGAALARFLADQMWQQCVVESWRGVSWEHVLQRAGTGPCGLGGARWNHWAAVRRPNPDGTLSLMNPAPGWMGVGDTLTREQFDRLGPFSMIYIYPSQSPVEEDADMDAALAAENATLKEQLQELRSYSSAVSKNIISPVVEQLEAERAKPSNKRQWMKLAEHLVNVLAPYAG